MWWDCYQHVYMSWATFRRYDFYMFSFAQFPQYFSYIRFNLLIYVSVNSVGGLRKVQRYERILLYSSGKYTRLS